MIKVEPILEESWKKVLMESFNSDYFQQLKEFIIEEKKNHLVYPPGSLIFNALDLTPFNKVKVVIIGQDPYHGQGQAHGLCFSVPEGVMTPPSLVNIFKELNTDLGIEKPRHGNLEKWAKQGILLLNATLTVRAKHAGSHQNKGWEIFTNTIISELSEKRDGLIFLLWGNYAQEKDMLIDTSRHYILKAAHPSPFSSHRGFFGCKHFSKTNEILKQTNLAEIDWRL